MPVDEFPVDDQADTASSISSNSSSAAANFVHPSSSNSSEMDLFFPQHIDPQRLVAGAGAGAGAGTGASPHSAFIVPAEPSLESILKQVAGTATALDQIETVKLRVISSMVSLQRLNVFLPNLVHLNLDGSAIMSLRDLGCHLEKLRRLNVSRCGLTTLDGTSGFQGLVELIADFNAITHVGACSNLTALKILSLKGNLIDNLGTASFLSFCPELRDLNLHGNHVTGIANYRMHIKQVIPQLTILDDQLIAADGNDKTGCCDAFSSDTSSLSSLDESVAVQWRPTSADALTTHSESNNCPATAFESQSAANDGRKSCSATRCSLVKGPPIAGNIIGRVRARAHRTAWAEPPSSVLSDSIESGDNNEHDNDNRPSIDLFASQMPTVSAEWANELKLNLTDLLSPATDAGFLMPPTTNDLLTMSRKWRAASKANRTAINNGKK